MSYHVLIVDDSPAMRRVVERVLLLSGLEIASCQQAANGREAIDLLARQPVDFILTDINMPVMNGEALVRSMAQDDNLRSIPVMVVSTDATEERMRQMMELGAKGYLTKPFTPEGLREHVERVLGVSHAV